MKKFLFFIALLSSGIFLQASEKPLDKFELTKRILVFETQLSTLVPKNTFDSANHTMAAGIKEISDSLTKQIANLAKQDDLNGALQRITDSDTKFNNQIALIKTDLTSYASLEKLIANLAKQDDLNGALQRITDLDTKFSNQISLIQTALTSYASLEKLNALEKTVANLPKPTAPYDDKKLKNDFEALFAALTEPVRGDEGNRETTTYALKKFATIDELAELKAKIATCNATLANSVTKAELSDLFKQYLDAQNSAAQGQQPKPQAPIKKSTLSAERKLLFILGGATIVYGLTKYTTTGQNWLQKVLNFKIPNLGLNLTQPVMPSITGTPEVTLPEAPTLSLAPMPMPALSASLPTPSDMI